MYRSDIVSVETIAMTIRNILIEYDEVYGQELYNIAKKITEFKSNYASFRANYINPLNKTGLMIKTRTEPSQTPGFQPRQYWKINPGKREDLTLWRNPRETLLKKKRGRPKK